jgi:flagellar motor switch protein FliM
MNQVEPFPFEMLPQLTGMDVRLRKQLLQIFETATAPGAIPGAAAEAFAEILGGPISLKLITTESRTGSGVSGEISEDSLVAVIRLDPLSQRAVLVFDGLLAQFLVAAILSGKPPLAEQAAEFKLKPLTVLQEGVVTYILIDLVERLAAKLGKKNIQPVFDNLERDVLVIGQLFGESEALAFMPFKLSWSGHDFYLKLFLPLPAAEKLGMMARQKAYVRERVQDLGGFSTQVHLEVGHVTLTPAELGTLELGDILFFDEWTIGLKDGRIEGEAQLCLSAEMDNAAFQVSIVTGSDGVQAKVLRPA